MNVATKNHSRLATILSLVLLLGLVATSAALGQAEPGAGPDDAALEEILQGDDLLLTGEGYTYDPGNRRDPFKSLLLAREGTRALGPRPEGIPGLLIEEIDLSGIFVTPSGPVAQVQSTQGEKSHLLHEGDQLYDGDVVSIGSDEIVFKQIVDDPTAVKPFREVVKKLNP